MKHRTLSTKDLTEDLSDDLESKCTSENKQHKHFSQSSSEWIKIRTLSYDPMFVATHRTCKMRFKFKYVCQQTNVTTMHALKIA